MVKTRYFSPNILKNCRYINTLKILEKRDNFSHKITT
jgi:hypothetical protein